MRTIDADSIQYTMLYKENWLKGAGVEAQAVWKSDIDAMPTVDPVRHGKWIRTGRKNIYGGCELECSECGDKVMIQHIEDELYCRHCGAKMDGEEEC